MGKIEQDKLRTVINKRTVPSEILIEELTDIEVTLGGIYTCLLESIYDAKPENFLGVYTDAQGTSPYAGEYSVNYDSAVITFSVLPTIPLYAKYRGGGSIIWAEDINNLNNAAKILDNAITTLEETKQDNLPSQVDQGGKVLTTDGTNLSWSEISAPIYVDNSTITKNNNDEIQTVGIKDVRTNSTLKTWTGTRVQYDSITTKDPNTLYNIIDDTDTTTTILNALYPVGSVYIGTMNVCPLATLGIGTWELIAADRVLQGSSQTHTAGSTIEAGLPNITGSLGNQNVANETLTGCFDKEGNVSAGNYATGSYFLQKTIFDASRSNPIYSDSVNTVQPPAFVVNIWRRIA